jgi:hypothetical protein
VDRRRSDLQHVAHVDVAAGVADDDLELVGLLRVRFDSVTAGGPSRSTKYGFPLTEREVQTWGADVVTGFGPGY